MQHEKEMEIGYGLEALGFMVIFGLGVFNGLEGVRGFTGFRALRVVGFTGV